MAQLDINQEKSYDRRMSESTNFKNHLQCLGKQVISLAVGLMRSGFLLIPTHWCNSICLSHLVLPHRLHSAFSSFSWGSQIDYFFPIRTLFFTSIKELNYLQRLLLLLKIWLKLSTRFKICEVRSLIGRTVGSSCVLGNQLEGKIFSVDPRQLVLLGDL